MHIRKYVFLQLVFLITYYIEHFVNNSPYFKNVISRRRRFLKVYAVYWFF
jgi:hypothetical protein